MFFPVFVCLINKFVVDIYRQFVYNVAAVIIKVILLLRMLLMLTMLK